VSGAPAHPATVRGLTCDHDGRWLIVRPTGADRWHLPGGLIEQNESPADACRREFREELGMDLEPGWLYAVGWNPPLRPGRNARFTFIFHMGAHDADALSPMIHLRVEELDSWRWALPDEALGVLHPDIAERLTAARNGPPSAVYLETSQRPADL
jgi:8-oxo-dGTP pyrophosphatase MutT (NUDIX family)